MIQPSSQLPSLKTPVSPKARLLLLAIAWTPYLACAEVTNTASLLSAPALPSVGPSLLRVFGALAVVIGFFLGCAWIFRNGRQFRFGRGGGSALQVIESRSLGGRHALYVIAYEHERLLLASSPAGISLLTSLPRNIGPSGNEDAPPAANLSFAQALARLIRKEPVTANRSGGLA